MASGGEEQVGKIAELGQTLKEGERIVAPTRRPDGTLRKPIRIRPGYVPQEEVALYQSKGALWKKEMAAQALVPPGYDPVIDVKPKAKSAKRNERKKEKRQQAALEKSKNTELRPDLEQELDSKVCPTSETIATLGCQMEALAVSENSSSATPSDAAQPAEITADSHSSLSSLDKKIRAVKKKIRLAEAQQQKHDMNDMNPDQLEKLAKLKGWRQELMLLESHLVENATS